MNSESPKRAYRQTARADAARATGERILDAFTARLRDTWFDEMRLEDVARDADTTVQTVIRRFGGKDGLLAAMHERMGTDIQARRAVRPGDIDAIITTVAEDYEAIGDLVVRSLAQEDRHTAIREMTDIGRAMHRQWMENAFLPWLDRMAGRARRQALDGLVVAADLYVWKLVRRDMGRPQTEYRALVEKMLAAALGISVPELYDPPKGAQA